MVKVAIASSDGKNVNEHFGRAAFFHIYCLSESDYSKEGIRDVVAACQHVRGHSETNFERVLSLVSDCDALLVSKIGESAAAYLIERNVRVFEVQGEIDAVLKKIIAERLLKKEEKNGQLHN